jgi:hypothetical protein
VYIAGYDGDAPCYWIDGVQYSLPVTAGSDGEACAIAVSGSDVYIAGYYESEDDTLMPCYWLNGVQYVLPVTAGYPVLSLLLPYPVRMCISRVTNMTEIPILPVTGSTA